MEWTKREQHFKVFEKYMDAMKGGRSIKYFYPGDSNYHDKKIRKFLETYKIPIPFEEVIVLLDTTVFHSAKEGFLFTTAGVVVKEVMEKLYFLNFAKIDRAELEETVNEDTTEVTSKIKVIFKDGTEKYVLDYDLRKSFFVDYINEATDAFLKIEKGEEKKGSGKAGISLDGLQDSTAKAVKEDAATSTPVAEDRRQY